jgi:hypothetical protein
VQDEFGVSEWRVCRSWSTPVSATLDSNASAPRRGRSQRAQSVLASAPLLGMAKAHGYLQANGFHINHKKLQRPWREEEGLRVPRKHKNTSTNQVSAFNRFGQRVPAVLTQDVQEAK